MTDLERSKRLHSGAYVEMYERKPISRLARLIPLMHLRGDEVLMDVACGNAMLLPLVSEHVSQYCGVDFSEDFIRAAQRRAKTFGIGNCTFYCQDVIEFCRSRPGSFDIATAFDFSEHIDDDDFVKIFSAVHGSLKTGGRLLLHTPNLDFFMERLKAAGILPQFPEHIAVRTRQANIDLLVSCGFARDQIQACTIPHYNVLRLVHPLRHVPGIGRLFEARLFMECRK